MKKFFKDISSDFFNEIWTFLAAFGFWLTLTGSAKVVIGKVTLIAFIAWVLTLRLRNPKGE